MFYVHYSRKLFAVVKQKIVKLFVDNFQDKFDPTL